MTRIVVTGASGQYGRSFTDKLISQGRAEDLILITRTPAKLAERERQGCTVRYGDFDHPDTLVSAVSGGDSMLLISGTRVGARVLQHQAAINAASQAGIKHIAYTSFIGIDDPANPAEVRHDHIDTEALIRESGMAWTMLRDAHYADAMIINAGPNHMAQGQWYTNSGQGREAMVWRDDCVNAAVAVLTTPGHRNKIYNITGPHLQTFKEVGILMEKITGCPLEVIQVNDQQMYDIFDAMGVPRRPVDDQSIKGIPWNSDDMVSFGRAIREGYLDICTDDVERLTGNPARSVQHMIEEHCTLLQDAANAHSAESL